MDGNEGQVWPWCVGFIQTIIDQACTVLQMDFRSFMLHTYSCDVLATDSLSKGQLIENRLFRKEPERILPGDIFLNVRVKGKDWIHTEIILERDGDWIHTIEGNTNAGGSREGMEVRQRMRNFMENNIDVLSIK